MTARQGPAGEPGEQACKDELEENVTLVALVTHATLEEIEWEASMAVAPAIRGASVLLVAAA
eukprot:scaffold291397_cov14-Tisochrysis_lutea.AAC.1